jgi:hypothetical protein
MDKHFEHAKDLDFDLRYMAARELTEILENKSAELSEDQKMKIIDVLIEQLDDENKEVKGHSVRCLSKCVSYMSQEGLQKVMSKIFTGFYKEDIEIYATCFKSIANLIDPSLYQNLISISLPEIAKFIKDGSKNESFVEESVDIFQILLLKFSNFINQEPKLLELVNDEVITKTILGKEGSVLANYS